MGRRLLNWTVGGGNCGEGARASILIATASLPGVIILATVGLVTARRIIARRIPKKAVIALHEPARQGDIESVERLLQAGADINARDND